jgi:hypothetical protein
VRLRGQKVDDGLIAVGGGAAQRGVAGGVLDIDARAAGEKQFDDRGGVGCDRRVDRCNPEAVSGGDIRVCTLVQQPACDLDMSEEARKAEAREAVWAELVDVGGVGGKAERAGFEEVRLAAGQQKRGKFGVQAAQSTGEAPSGVRAVASEGSAASSAPTWAASPCRMALKIMLRVWPEDSAACMSNLANLGVG